MAEKQKYTVHQTQFELSPASNEQGFCFTHYNAPSDRACIGHLRGDFGETGTTFHHTWWPHNAHLITPSFNTELKDVITGLRQNGLLKDRKTMLARSMRFRTAIIPTEGRNTMAFRIETPEHLFYLRCIPNKGEYNFYCYGYNKTMLMEVLRQQKKLPRIAWAELDSSHEVVAICYGESGYHKWEPEGYIAMTSTEIVDDKGESHEKSTCTYALPDHADRMCHYPYRTDGDGNARVCYHCNPRYSSIGGNHNT